MTHIAELKDLVARLERAYETKNPLDLIAVAGVPNELMCLSNFLIDEISALSQVQCTISTRNIRSVPGWDHKQWSELPPTLTFTMEYTNTLAELETLV